MALTKIRLGDYIVRSTENNHDLKYGTDLITGVTSQGIFAEPRGTTLDVDLTPYKIVNNGAFVYNPTRLDLGSIAYRTEGLCIVLHLYMVFYLTDEGKKIIDPQYLFMYFRRDEFLREVTFRNFGSQRPEFNFKDMSEIIVLLPPIDIQKKYVAIYNSLLENQKSYERGLEDLKLVCDAYIEDLRRKYPSKRIGEFIEIVDNRNNALKYGITEVKGISTGKEFIETKANMDGVGLTSYKIVNPNEFAYVPDTSRRGEKIAIAYNSFDTSILVSSIYTVFRVCESDKLNSKYLFLFFNRSEFDRYSRFNSWGSARETFDWNDMQDVCIPIPDINIQKSIAEIADAYSHRISINEKLKQQIKDICPILIKGSIEDGRKF